MEHATRIIFETITMIKEFFLAVPKTEMRLVILLLIIIIIAFYVNRKRDEKGKVSFIDKSKKGVMGVRLYELDKKRKKNKWLLPLWMPENNLILRIKTLLKEGEYEIEAYWEESSLQPAGDLFDTRPIDKEEYVKLSEVCKFGVSRSMEVEFMLSLSGNTLQIDSPNNESLKVRSDQKAFPLTITDSSLTGVAARFKKARKNRIWELPLIDGRLLTDLKSENKIMNRKLDGMVAKNKQLESDLNFAVQQQLQLKHEMKELKEQSGAEEI